MLSNILVAPLLDAMQAKHLRLFGWDLPKDCAKPSRQLGLLGILGWRWRAITNLVPGGHGTRQLAPAAHPQAVDRPRRCEPLEQRTPVVNLLASRNFQRVKASVLETLV